MPVIEAEIEEEIQAVLDPIGIYNGPFTADKYKNVKKNLTEGKSPSPDGISPGGHSHSTYARRRGEGVAKKRMFAYEGEGGSLRSSTYACKKRHYTKT